MSKIINSIEREPFWMSNPEWYEVYRDTDDDSPLNIKIRLTEKAPKEAIEDYDRDKNKPRVFTDGDSITIIN